MTEKVTPARRRAEDAFALLIHAPTSVQRDITDAETATEERALKTQSLRLARLERDRNLPPRGSAPRTKNKAKTLGAAE